MSSTRTVQRSVVSQVPGPSDGDAFRFDLRRADRCGRRNLARLLCCMLGRSTGGCCYLPGPLTLRIMLRVWSSMNSTRTWVTPPREPGNAISKSLLPLRAHQSLCIPGRVVDRTGAAENPGDLDELDWLLGGIHIGELWRASMSVFGRGQRAGRLEKSGRALHQLSSARGVC